MTMKSINELIRGQSGVKRGSLPREGVIIERPLNDLFHDCRDVILTSRMAVSNIFLTVAVI